jgi:hypothetical protein
MTILSNYLYGAEFFKKVKQFAAFYMTGIFIEMVRTTSHIS